jgi:hypothetical protein
VGVALLGTVFFGAAARHSLAAAFTHTAPCAAGAFALCALLSLVLPGTARTDEELSAG